MADQTTTPTTSPIGSTPMPGKYTSEKLFLQLSPTEFNSHESDINNNGQIAFVSNGDSSFIYAKGVKVGGTDIKVEDLNLSNYATKNDVSTAIGALDVTDTAQTGKYVSAVSEKDGKITVSRASLPTVSIDNNNKEFKIGTNKYTLMINNNVLSIQEDIPVSFTSFAVNPTTLATSGDNVTRTTDYVGKSYTGATIQKTVNNTDITLTASIYNPQGKQFAYTFKNESGTVIHSGTSTDTSVTCTVKQRDYFNDGTSATVANGTFTWAKRTASSTITCKSNKNTNSDGVANETFSCVIAGTTKTAKIAGGQSCSFSATPKVPFMRGTAGTGASCTTLIQDITFGSIPTSFDQNFTFAKGDIPTFAIPSCLSKTLTCFNDTGALQDTSLKKIGTQPLTLNGCTTNYDVYKYGNSALLGAVTIKIKF